MHDHMPAATIAGAAAATATASSHDGRLRRRQRAQQRRKLPDANDDILSEPDIPGEWNVLRR